jgi:hypothetical protein
LSGSGWFIPHIKVTPILISRNWKKGIVLPFSPKLAGNTPYNHGFQLTLSIFKNFRGEEGGKKEVMGGFKDG